MDSSTGGLPQIYFFIDQKSFYASVECVERKLDPMTALLVVADSERSKNTICLAVSVGCKKKGVKNRCRLWEVPIIVECRKRKGVSTMTRKQALHRAIEVLKLQGENEAAGVLEELTGELPLIHWTDSSIRDTVEQYIVDNGKAPTPSVFKKAGMPPHTVIQNKYGITLSEWLRLNYPTQKPSQRELKEEYTAAFIEDYNRIKPRGADEFNAKRRPSVKGWRTVAKYHNVDSWRGLLKVLGLHVYFDMIKDHVPVKFDVRVHTDYDFTD